MRNVQSGLDWGLAAGSPPPDSSCPANMIVDASTWQCAPICGDDSRPCNGQCIGYSGGPLATQGAPCPGVSPPPAPSTGMSTGAMVATGVAVVGGIGLLYLFTRKRG